MDKHIRRLDQDLKKFEHELDIQRKHSAANAFKPTRYTQPTPGVLPSLPVALSSQAFQTSAPSMQERAGETTSRQRKYAILIFCET